jgi:hypothetical protein
MIRLKNIITETSLSDDDLLDIIMDYTDEPEAGLAALEKYRQTGDFGDENIDKQEISAMRLSAPM